MRGRETEHGRAEREKITDISIHIVLAADKLIIHVGGELLELLASEVGELPMGSQMGVCRLCEKSLAWMSREMRRADIKIPLVREEVR